MDSMELVYDAGRLHRLMSQFAGQDMPRSEAGVVSAVLELTPRGIGVARERRRRISESLRTLLADRTPDADALIEATATHLHNLVGELEAALAEAAVRG